ncbi:hypothetical protein HHI36_019653 [Cryptolaemus montrouzieri]|uniref:Sugar phosphate phosphatase n=1 Tax=Cryptolaemus montrouzieri TaxID=559131 RepID=A0ABD2N9H3_9CUCU
MKQSLFWLALPVMIKTGQYLKNIYKYPSMDDKDDFEKLIKLNLWANQSDYIMSRNYVQKSFTHILNISKKDPFIACNHCENAWRIISERNQPSNVIAFICDNVGFDLFLELCVADFLYTNYYARTLHFHVKHIPWFISDTMEKDIYWMIQQLSKNSEKNIQELAKNWKEHFRTGRWKIIVRKYWTLPIGFTRIKELDPVLYKMLEETKLIVIKGDLNYRKCLEDKNLDPTTPIRKALNEFCPSNILLIRILKCDVVCDIPQSNIEKLEKVNDNWMDCGHFGVIQFAPKPSIKCDCLDI